MSTVQISAGANAFAKQLLLVDKNSELIEIEYETVDNMMVFETNMLGIFLLAKEI